MAEEVKKAAEPAAPAAAEAAPAAAEGEAAKAKRGGKSIPAGIAFIRSTFNNTQVSIADSRGGVISWSSAGKCGFRGSKKNTPYAAQMAAEDASKTAYDAGLRRVKVYVKGPGAGRESAIRTINNAGITVSEIVDITPMPHNGCRPKGRRKV